MLYRQIRFFLTIIIIASYLFIDILYFYNYFEVSHYIFICCLALISLYYIKKSYVRIIFLYALVSNFINIFLVIFNVYSYYLQIIYAIFLVVFSGLNFYRQHNFKKIKLEEGKVYKLYKTSEDLSLLSFFVALVTNYPLVCYYNNGTIYYVDKKVMRFKKKSKTYNYNVFAKECKNPKKVVHLLNQRNNTRYNLIFNNCIINEKL